MMSEVEEITEAVECSAKSLDELGGALIEYLLRITAARMGNDE